MRAIQGLSESEVLARRQRGEGNDIAVGTSRSFIDILRQNMFTFFNNVLFTIGILLIALGRVNDALTSVGLGLLNALISTYQEVRSKRQLDKIALLTRPQVTVIREGQEKVVDPAELVSGDIFRVRPGDQIVVDGIVIGDSKVEVDESLLTGESDLIRKQEGDTLLSGSFCVTGSALGQAEKVGADSFANQLTVTARAFQITKTPLQSKIDFVIRTMMLIALLMGLVIFAAAILENLPFIRMVQIAAVITGQIPYGLFLMIIVAYALGAVQIARQGALVQQVNAIESLSNVDVLCMDKTGTLTANRINYHDLYPLSHTETNISEEILEQLLGSFARSAAVTNPTSEAIVAGLPGEAHQPVDEVPFSSARKWSALAFHDDPMSGVYVLGAVEMLQPYLPPDTTLPESMLFTQVREWSDVGLRVLLFAHNPEVTTLHNENDQPHLPPLTPLALLSLSDELRPQTRETLAAFAEAGIQLKIISGDNPHTVAALAKQAGLTQASKVVSGVELAQMDEAQFDQIADEITIFGRISPEQKEKLVDSLLKRGRYVAMMGDGVNDILSLKKAKVGVAMQSGSNATRNVADMVLLNDSFAALLPAFREGKRIFSGMRSILALFLTRAFSAALLIIAITMVGLDFPFEPAQVALTTFTVGIPVFFLAMWARPETSNEGLSRFLIHFVLPAAILSMLFGLLIFTFFHNLVLYHLTELEFEVPPQVITRLENYTGLTYDLDENFSQVVAAIAAQTGLSIFTSYSAFLLIVFVKPPIRFFEGGAKLSPDKRPTVLAFGLLAVFVVILSVRSFRNYFGLIFLGWRPLLLIGAVTMVWGLLLLGIWRANWLERFLVLDALDE